MHHYCVPSVCCGDLEAAAAGATAAAASARDVQTSDSSACGRRSAQNMLDPWPDDIGSLVDEDLRLRTGAEPVP